MTPRDDPEVSNNDETQKEIAIGLRKKSMKMQSFYDHEIKNRPFTKIFMAAQEKSTPLYTCTVYTSIADLIAKLWSRLILAYDHAFIALLNEEPLSVLLKLEKKTHALKKEVLRAIKMEKQVDRETRITQHSPELAATSVAIKLAAHGGHDITHLARMSPGRESTLEDVQFSVKQMVDLIAHHDTEALAHWQRIGSRIRDALIPILKDYHERRHNMLNKMTEECDKLIAILRHHTK